MASEPQLAAGEDLGAYRIEMLIARGGMGEVYRALDRRLGRLVALKLLAPEIADEDQFRERFLRESRLAASLDHPNVLPIYEAGEFANRLFIAMRFVEGTDLRQVLRQSAPLDAERALALIAPVAGALDAAHARGLVHRDVKPANVLIARAREEDADEHIYLSDFGLTTLSSDAVDVGQFSGTADYAAPELVTGGRIDALTDVYALGCVLFEALTGQPPYRSGSVMAVLWGHVNDPPPSATARNRALPEAVDGVFQTALAKDPAKRPQTCRALVDSARCALGLTRPEEFRRSRRLPVVAAAVAGVAVAALVALIWIGRGDDAGVGTAASAGSIVRIDPATNSVLARTGVAGRPTSIAVGRGHVWAVDAGSSTVVRLDAARGAPRTSSAHGVPSDVAVAGDVVAVANGADGTAALFDNSSGVFQQTVQLGGFGLSASSVATDEHWAWVAARGQLEWIDLGTGMLARTSTLPFAHHGEGRIEVSATDVAVGEGSVWVTGDVLNPTLWRIDPERRRRTTAIALPFGPDAVAVAEGTVWVANQLDDSVTRVDARSGRVGPTIDVGHEPVALAASKGLVWVANRLDGTVSRINAKTNQVAATVAVGDAAEDVAVGAGAVWVATGRS
jgi:YVTN family beta-propeller protein